MPERGERPRVDDLFVDVAGEPGWPAAVFVHGGGPSGRMWRAHLDALGDRFHCLAPDLPGFGRSNHLPAVSLVEAAALVAELIETRVPGRRATVVGLSYGGAVTLALMGGHPGVLDRVVVDGAGVRTWGGDRVVIAGVAAVSPFLRTRGVRAVLGRLDLSGLAEELRSTSPAAFRRAFAEGWVAPLSHRLLAATCPTLLVGGEREQTVRASNAALAELLPRAEARFAPSHGHAWFARDLDLHISMVEAWLTGAELPHGLVGEPSSQAAVERVLARLGSRG
jgi:pimeloyl-ACP methyl ester carboxylesterase